MEMRYLPRTMRLAIKSALPGLLLLLTLSGPGCRTFYYSAWETLGKHKRDLLKSHVEQTRDDQKKATEQFKDALTRMKELYAFEGGKLEKTYNALKTDYDRCVQRADTVKSRIDKVEVVASDLFAEWQQELESMSNETLKQSSRLKLQETRQKYSSLQTAMKRAASSMEPVLGQFRDQVVYLKHNLNAQAVGALRGETLDIERDIRKLIEDMNASIAQADAFIKEIP